MTGSQYYAKKVTKDFITNFFNGLMAKQKVGKHNAYPGKYFVEQLKERHVDVSLQDVYNVLDKLQKDKMPTLISGSTGFFLASGKIDLLRYQNRLKRGIKTLVKEVDRVQLVRDIWENAKG